MPHWGLAPLRRISATRPVTATSRTPSDHRPAANGEWRSRRHRVVSRLPMSLVALHVPSPRASCRPLRVTTGHRFNRDGWSRADHRPAARKAGWFRIFWPGRGTRETRIPPYDGRRRWRLSNRPSPPGGALRVAHGTSCPEDRGRGIRARASSRMSTSLADHNACFKRRSHGRQHLVLPVPGLCVAARSPPTKRRSTRPHSPARQVGHRSARPGGSALLLRREPHPPPRRSSRAGHRHPLRARRCAHPGR